MFSNLESNPSAKELCFRSFKNLIDSIVFHTGLVTKDRSLIFERVIEHLVLCLVGNMDPEYYLISLDPGSGKTEVIKSILKAWKTQGFQPDGSVMVAVSRMKEIDSIVKDAGLSKEDYAVLSGNEDYYERGLGFRNIQNARILFTTHQMIESRVAGRSFSGLADFHYRGSGRSLRMFDEGIMPAKAISIRLDTLGSVADSLRSVNPDYIAALESISEQAEAVKMNGIVSIPATLPPARLKLLEVTDGIVLSKRQADALGNLRDAKGQRMLVANDKRTGLTLIGSTAVLPDDLAPLTIFDASGRTKSTYPLWKEHRGGLVNITTLITDYRNMDIHLWKGSFGKSSLKDPDWRSQVLRIISRKINEKPTEDWLVIGPKSGFINIESELGGYLDRPDNMHYVYWGNHHGTNAYAKMENVIVIGSHMYDEIAYKSQFIAASGSMDAKAIEVSWPVVREGEFRHNLLQAVCRSNIRNISGGACGKATVYMLLSNAFDPTPQINQTFPGCRITEWSPVKKPLPPQARQVISIVARIFKDKRTHSIKRRVIREELGMSDSRYSDVIRGSAFQRALSRLGVGMEKTDFVRLGG